MKIAALYDIHGNLPALDAVLARVRTIGVDLLVIGGDVIPGPMPSESLDRLASVDIPMLFLAGNGEREILAVRSGVEPNVPKHYHPMMRWVASEISPTRAVWLAAWPATITLQLPGVGDLLFCHATPSSDSQLFTSNSTEALLDRVIGETSADLLICGHTHMQFRRRYRRCEIINAGSVGMSYGAGGAEWLLIDGAVSLQRTEYDRALAAQLVRQTKYPLAEEFASGSILQPPSTESMLAAYTRAAE